MSRGPGKRQRRIAEAIQADAYKRWTVLDAAVAAYPGEVLTEAMLDVASRALNRLIPIMELQKSREGLKGTLGWRYTYIPKSALAILRSGSVTAET